MLRLPTAVSRSGFCHMACRWGDAMMRLMVRVMRVRVGRSHAAVRQRGLWRLVRAWSQGSMARPAAVPAHPPRDWVRSMRVMRQRRRVVSRGRMRWRCG